MSELTEIPGIGKVVSSKLPRVGISCVEDFAGQDPEILYEKWCAAAHDPYDVDRCVLYVLREAVYYANGGRDPEKLKWWNWKEEKAE